MLTQNRTLTIYAVAVVLSVLMHVFALRGLTTASFNAPPPRPMELAVFTPEPPPEPEPPKPPPPPPPPPKKEKIVEVTPVDIPPEPLPPPPTDSSPPPDAEPPKPVFGVSADSTTKSDSGMSVRVGNTVMKEPEKEYTPPTEVKSYGPVPMNMLDRKPKVRGRCDAEYTDAARAAAIEGNVTLELTIDTEGNVVGVKVVKGLGYGLDQSAVTGMMRCRFEPGEQHGNPVTTIMKMKYAFVLANARH